MYKLIIHGDLPCMNEIIAVAKRHHMQYSKMKKNSTELVKVHAWHLPKDLERVFITFRWFCKNRKKDPDNIVVGKKFILDGLVEAGVLKNDGWKQIAGFKDEFEVDRDNPRIEIIIEEVIDSESRKRVDV